MSENKINKKAVVYTAFILLSGLFLALLFLPKDYFDTGQSVCVSVLLFDFNCFGCGMTRAIQHLIHLDFEGAYCYNKLSFIVLPLSVFMICKELLKWGKFKVT
jgi:hypothetical protein